MSGSTDRVNVVVVGGGAVGCATAYYLARAGARVTLLERGPLCSESSSANAGSATVSTREGLLLTLGRESIRLMEEATQELETDFEFERVGSLVLLRTEEDYKKQSAFVERQRGQGVDVQLLDARSALELEPTAYPGILGGVYSPLDVGLSPYAYTVGLGRAARRLGATVRIGVEVTALKTEGGRVRAATTREGEVPGDVIVVAAGAWSPALTRTIGLEIPVEPGRGQILVTEPRPTLTRRTVKNTGHIYLRQTRRGNYVIGSQSEKVGFNKGLTAEKVREYLREAEELVPALAGVRVLRGWAGIRPLSPDNQPILGEVQGYDGLMLATGHSRFGVFYSAATSKMVADLIMTGNAGFPIEPLGLSRFARVA